MADMNVTANAAIVNPPPSKRRQGRPAFPRDAEGNIIRPAKNDAPAAIPTKEIAAFPCDKTMSLFPELEPKVPAGIYVTMEELGKHVGAHPKTVRRYIDKYPDLADAVISRGEDDGSQGWKIDLEKVDKWRIRNGIWVGNNSMDEDGNPVARSINEKKSSLQTELLEIQIKEKRGMLIDRTVVVSQLRTAFAYLAKEFDLMPGMIARDLGWAPDTTDKFRIRLEDYRRALVRECKDFLKEEPHGHQA